MIQIFAYSFDTTEHVWLSPDGELYTLPDSIYNGTSWLSLAIIRLGFTYLGEL